MDVSQTQSFCAALPGASVTEWGEPANLLAYFVGGKRFAHFKTSEPERWRFSFRVAPERFLELTDQPGIKPARWLGRHHWITVVDVQRMPESELQALIRGSHQAALASLSKARQAAITGCRHRREPAAGAGLSARPDSPACPAARRCGAGSRRRC